MGSAERFSPKFLQVVLEHVPAAIVVTGPADCDTPIQYANREFLRLTGYSLDQIRGQNPRILQPNSLSDEQQSQRHQIAGQIRAGESAASRLINQRSDGTTYWAEFRAKPLTSADGSIVAWVGAQVDVSDRVEADNKIANLLSTFVDREIDLLVHLLWKRSPDAARISERHARLAGAIGPHLHGVDDISLVRAARLALIGFLVEDDDVLDAIDMESDLSVEQSNILRDYPLRSAEIVMSLPQMEHEAEAIQGHRICPEQEPSGKNSSMSTQSALGQTLTILAVLDTNIRRHLPLADAFDEMSRQCSDLDESLIADCRSLLPILAENGWPERWESMEIPVSEIMPDSLANQDIIDSAGRLLLKSGQLLSDSLVQRLKGMAKDGSINSTIQVTVRR